MRVWLRTVDTLLAELAVGIFLLLGDLSGGHIVFLWRNFCFLMKKMLYLQG